MRLASKRTLLQKLTITLLVFIAALTVIALFSRHIINKKGQYLLSVIERNNYPAEQAGNVLLLLNQAENDFQLAIFSYNPDKLGLYKTKLKQAFLQIDSIRLQKVDTSFILNNKQRAETRWLYQQKIQLSNQIFALKNNFDSVLVLAGELTAKGTQPDPLHSSGRMAKQKTVEQVQSADTLRNQPAFTTRKKGFFRKLKDAFSNKQDTIRGTAVTLINKTAEKRYLDSVSRTVTQSTDAFYQQLLSTLRQRQQQLSARQANLFTTNQRIMEQLKLLVANLQEYSRSLSDNLKKIALQEYHSTQSLLDNIGIISLLLVFIFSILLIVYINKINRAEKQLWNEYELATSLAQQKTDLLATMSHEIRNPLNSIIGFLNEFKKSGLSDQQAEMMDSVQLSSDMLLATVNDVLDMSKLESGQFQLQTEQFNPYNTLRLTTESMRYNARDKQLVLDYQFTGDQQLNVTGDTFRLKQIVLNLLSNAIKFTSRGSVTVKVALKQDKDKMLLEVTITDTGIGILRAQQARLFSKYYQAASSNGKTGTGLGLYICYKLVQLQQGTIRVNSTPGKGTSVSFSIPYSPVQQPSGSITGDTPVNTSVFSGKRILMADDNSLNLKLISIMTQHWDVTLLFAHNGREALRLLQKEQVDLVITDMQMTEMNGSELVQAIRNSKSAHLPVVLSTAHRYTEAQLEQLKMTGFTAIITKPFDETQLAKKLFAALQTTTKQTTIQKAIQ